MRRAPLIQFLCLGIAFLNASLFAEQLRKPSQGFYLDLPSRGTTPDKGITDADDLYLMVIQSRRTARIRNEQIRLEDLGSRLRTIFSFRSERRLLVTVEGRLAFGEVVKFLDAARAVEHLQFALLTPGSTPTKRQPTLFLKDQAIYTQYFFRADLAK